MATGWLLALLALALCPGMASALTVESFEISRTDMQAGGHPDLSASFAFGESGQPEAARDVRLGLTEGLFIGPDAVPKCSAASFAAFECAPVTQVGLITLRAEYAGDPSHLLGTAPVYALVPAPGEIARFGFIAPVVNLPVEIPVTVRSASDYGLDLTFQNLPQLAPLAAAALTLWATPADPGHNAQRFAAGSAGAPADCPGVEGTGCIGGPIPSNIPSHPLLHNPTSCVGPLSSRLDLTTYEHPGNLRSASFVDPSGTHGCDATAFTPSLLTNLTTAQTRSPSGLTLALGANEEGFYSPTGTAQSQIKSVSVALPAGLKIDSAAAGAVNTCTDAQFAAGSAAPSSCPLDSKVGTFSVTVAGLDDPLEGSAYFGTPEPAGAYRLLLTASGAGFGTKLIGLLQPGSAGGPVTVALPNLPQLPLEKLALNLTEPELLRTPVRCGAYQSQATFTPWGSPAVATAFPTSDISLTATGPHAGPCPGPASDVGLTLSPPSMLADGTSTTVATATVADAGEIPVPGDEIIFASTDPDQRIGAVTDNEDGTYSARVTASATVGAATITATDAGAGINGTATLTQLPVPPRPTPIVPSSPIVSMPITSTPPLVTIVRKPPRQTHDRTPGFRFTSTAAGAIFSCKVDGQRLGRCTSPKTLPKLGFGAHTFSVLARDPTGTVSAPVTYGFTVRKRPTS